jgi:hypothetical protein
MNDNELLLHRHLQSVAALSNLGSTQIKLGAFDGAIDTFKTALRAINELLGADSNDALPCYSQMEAKLQRASSELMKTSTSAKCTYTSVPLDFSLHFHNRTMIKNLLKKSDSTVVPIYIDTCDVCCSKDEAEFLSAVILYNMGVSTLIQSRHAGTEKSAVESRRVSRKLFSLSLEVLEEQSRNLQKGEFQFLQSMSVSLLVLTSLVHVSTELEDVASVLVFDEKLEDAMTATNLLSEDTSWVWDTLFDRTAAGAA